MKFNLVLILLVIILIGLIYLTWSNKEGFGLSYDECMAKGYTKAYCVQTPNSVFGPDICMCENGTLGRRLPGFRGECVCVINSSARNFTRL